MDHARGPREAAEAIRDGDHIVVDTSRPRSLLERVATRSDLSNVSVYAYGYPYRDSTGLASLARTDGITVAVSMVPPSLRSLVDDGIVEFVPRSLYTTSRAPFGDAGRRRVALIQTPPIASGAETPVGAISTFGSQLVADADVTIVAANDRTPAPVVGPSVPTDDIDLVVTESTPAPVFSRGTVGDAERRIATHVTNLLPDDPTLQMGIGSVATAVARHLAGTVEVTLWTGLVGEGTRQLISAGSVASATCSVAVGHDEEFYEWTATTTDLEFVSSTVTHSPSRLEELSRFVSINSAMQVDLTGQANAETIGGRQRSGVGGQLEFTSAANAASDGLSILVLTSRTRSGTPRIVPAIADTDVVTTPRQVIDAVVTEWGVARLESSRRARARALVAVAHPDDRPTLERAASDRGLL